jgi:hypothetical protein
MARAKVLFDGEWVKTSMPSSRYDVIGARNADGTFGCEICHRSHAGAVWYSTKRRVIRCLKCFTPKQLE